MKKLILISLFFFSSIVHSEWIVLSCTNESGNSSIIEFNQELQKIRIDGNDKKNIKGEITDLSVLWFTEFNYGVNSIDRLTGVYSYLGPTDIKSTKKNCIQTKKKF
jgi:hypothetical protein